MIKSLAIKELRELLGIIALALLALGFVLFGLIGMNIFPWTYYYATYFPFSANAHASGQAFCMGSLGLLLGFRQTAWELHNGTFFFLLHRPLPRWIVFALKLTIGVFCMLAVNAAFVSVYAWWAATPQTHPTPFFWSMTLPAWQLGVTTLPVYLGAFLSGLRPGRWFGSRLLPAIAGIVTSVAASGLPWLSLGVLASIAASAVLIVCIFYYSRVRDF